MSRRLRFILPSTPASLQPVLVNPEDVQLRFEEKQDKQKTVYDRNARNRASISVGDQILMRKNSGGYQSAFVTEKTDAPRSYNVRTKDGAHYSHDTCQSWKPGNGGSGYNVSFSVNVLLRRFNLDPAACSLKLQVRIALNLNEGYA